MPTDLDRLRSQYLSSIDEAEAKATARKAARRAAHARSDRILLECYKTISTAGDFMDETVRNGTETPDGELVLWNGAVITPEWRDDYLAKLDRLARRTLALERRAITKHVRTALWK